MMTRAILLLVAFMGTAAAFVAPMTTNMVPPQLQAAKEKKGAFDGAKFDPARNSLARGGKNSWEFELDTMFVEEPKPKKVAVVAKKAAPVRFVAAKMPVVKKVVAKPVVAKKAVAAKPVAAKKPMAATTKKAAAPMFSFFKKAAPVVVKKEAPKNPFLALFQKK
jgi:hypothetical protein